MISVEDLASGAGASVEVIERMAARLPEQVDFLIRRHPKRHGGTRQIIKPLIPLDALTKNLHRLLSRDLPYAAQSHVYGFVKGRSTRGNAAQHLGKECVLRVDLDDFFPSISRESVAAALEERGLESSAAELCSRVTTIDGSLPIGLSTSPLFSNIVFDKTDGELARLATREGLVFTRYVDDLTFSGNVSDLHLERISAVLEGDGWLLNPRKTAFMRRGGPQYVTGLFVGRPDMPRIPRRIKRQMRWVCHVIARFGYETYMADFGGRQAGMRPGRLRGWARYIASVEPNVGYPMLRFLAVNLPGGYVDEDSFLEEDDFILFEDDLPTEDGL